MDLCFLSVVELSNLIRGRQVSPVEVAEAALRQIERLNGKLNAFITVTGEQALAAAREAEREIAAGRYRGPLQGMPVAVKDIMYTGGIRTTAGSRIMADFVPDEDATVVARLKEVGAVIVGKTNTHEFAFGPTNINPHYGDAHNPWDLERITGGSSGGSAAAVVSGMAAAGLGSDTGGSIRIPAAFCGATGIKPTYGRVSRYGVVPLAWSMDHVGPIARSAEDAAVVLRVLAGHDPRDPASSRKQVPDYAGQLDRDVRGMRVAVLRQYLEDPQEPQVREAFQRALEVLRTLGVEVGEVSLPEVEHAFAASSAIISAEAAAYHEENLRSRPQEYGADVRQRLEAALLVAATDYVKAQRFRRHLKERFLAALRVHDAILCPTEPGAAPRLDREFVSFEGLEEPRAMMATRYTRIYNLTGLPAASVPCGFGIAGMPVALQIAAAPFAEGTALRLAAAYQRVTDWHKRVPPAAT